MKRPAKVELKNGERFLTAPDVSIFTDDTTLIVGDVYDLEDFDLSGKQYWHPDVECWSMYNTLEGSPIIRQVARKKAVAETPAISPVKQAMHIAHEIFYSQATNGKAEGNIQKGMEMILEFAKGYDEAVNEGKAPEAMSEQELRQLFKNQSDCYVDNGSLYDVQAMTEDKFIEILKDYTITKK